MNWFESQPGLRHPVAAILQAIEAPEPDYDIPRRSPVARLSRPVPLEQSKEQRFNQVAGAGNTGLVDARKRRFGHDQRARGIRGSDAISTNDASKT
jgi:hypothetical protein